MGWAIPADTFLSPDTFRKRLPAAALVVLVHLIALVLFTARQAPQPLPQMRETILNLAPITPPAPEPSLLDAAPPVLRKPLSVMRPRANTAPDVNALLQWLGECALANAPRLSVEQRMRCRDRGYAMDSGPPPAQAPWILPPAEKPWNPKSRVKDPERWQAELDRKNSPVMLPGGIFLPLLALGAVLGQDNALTHPETWSTTKQQEDAARKALEDEKMNRGFTPKSPF